MESQLAIKLETIFNHTERKETMSDKHEAPKDGAKKSGNPIAMAAGGLLLLFIVFTVIIPGCAQGMADASVTLAQTAPAAEMAQTVNRKWLAIIGNIFLFALIGGLIAFAIVGGSKKKDGDGGN